MPVLESFFDNCAEFMDAKSRMGETVRFERILEKMAVPENEKVSVRNQLIHAFNDTAVVYLSAPDFASRFVRTAYLKCCKIKVAQHLPGI